MPKMIPSKMSSLPLSILVIWTVIQVQSSLACPYYCTCSNTVNRCSDFVGSLPSADLMQASGGGGGVGVEGGSGWDFSQGNNISVISKDSFKGLSQVTYLNLSHNLIEDIPDGAFRDLSSLQVLDLSYNKMKTIRKETFDGLRNLRVLNISHNLLWSYPDDTVFDNLRSLEEISLANPFLYCQCSLIGWITQWKEKKAVLISNDTVCNDEVDEEKTNTESAVEEGNSNQPVLLNDLYFKPKDCSPDAPQELRLPVFEMSPPSGSRQLSFEGDPLTLNCSATLPSEDYGLLWKHGSSLSSYSTEESRSAGDHKFHFYTWQTGAVTHSSISVAKLKTTHSGYWYCMIASKVNGDELLPAKNTYLMVVEQTADVCPKAVEETTRGTFVWPKTITGYQQSLPCPFGRSSLFARQPLAFRTCIKGGHWGESDLSTCEFASPFSRQISGLFMDSERIVLGVKDDSSSFVLSSLENIVVISHKLANVTTEAAVMENLEDVQYTALTVNNLFQFMNLRKIFEAEIIEPLIDTVSNAMSFNPLLLLKAERLFHSCTLLTHTLQNSVFFTVNKNTVSAVYRRATHNIAIRAFKIQHVRSFTGYTCALLVSSESGGKGAGSLGGPSSFMTASFKTDAMLECQDGVNQNVSTLQMGHSHINKVFAAVKVASPYVNSNSETSANSQEALSAVQNALGSDEFFKLQIVIFRNASLFPSQDIAIVSPVASAKIESLSIASSIQQPSNSKTTGVSSSSSSSDRRKPLKVDLAMFYGRDGTEYQIASGGGFKTGTMRASTWVVQKTTQDGGAAVGGVGYNAFQFKGEWMPSGSAGCKMGSTRLKNVSEVTCDSLATVAISTLLSPLDDGVQTVDASVQIGCAVCIVFSVLVTVTYIAFKGCIFATMKSIHVLVNFSIALFFLCLLFSFGNFFSSQEAGHEATQVENTSPLYLQSVYLYQKRDNLGVPYLACSLVFVALDYFLLVAAMWLILFNRNLCRQFQKIEEKHGLHQMQHGLMGGTGVTGGNALNSKRQSAVSSTQTKKNVDKSIYKFYLICWGCPFLVCLSSSFFSLKFHSQSEGVSRCWISPTVAAITSFLPVGICCIFCIVYMVKTLLIIPRLPRKLEVRQQCFNPSEHHPPQICSPGPLYLDGELELSALTDNESMHSSVVAPSVGTHSETNSRFGRQTNNGAQPNFVTATFSVKADSACCRQLRSALIFFILFFASWITASLIVFAEFHPHHRINAFKTQVSFMFAASCMLLGIFLFLKFCLFRSDVKQCYIALVTCQRQVTFPKPSSVTHSLYFKHHHNSYLSLESGLGGGSSHPSSYPPHPSLKPSLQNQTTSFTFSESISSDCMRNNNGVFYNNVDPLLGNSSSTRSHDKCRSVFPANVMGLRNTGSSRSGSSVRGGLDEELIGITMDKNVYPSGSAQNVPQHHRSQTNLPENGVPAWNHCHQPSLSGPTDHEAKLGLNQHAGSFHHSAVPYNTGVIAGRNTPVSIPPTPQGQPNKGPTTAAIHALGLQNFNSHLGNTASQFSPGGSKPLPMPDPYLTNRCNTPSSGISQQAPPPDLLQSYYASRNAKLKSAAAKNNSAISMQNQNQPRNHSQVRPNDSVRGHGLNRRPSSHVRSDSFSSDDSEDDDDDVSSTGQDVDEELRAAHQFPSTSRHINPGANSGGLHHPVRPAGKPPGVSNASKPYAKPRDQGETSV